MTHPTLNVPAPSLSNVRVESFGARSYRVASARSVGMGLNLQWGLNAGQMVFKYSFEFKVLDTDAPAPETPPAQIPEDALLAESTVELVMSYEIQADFTPDDAFMAAFGQSQGMRDAAPYVREIVNTSLVRLGFPGVIIRVIETDVAAAVSATG